MWGAGGRGGRAVPLGDWLWLQGLDQGGLWGHVGFGLSLRVDFD